MKEELKNQYSKVFDSEGNVKNCGRDDCICLIEMLNIEDPITDFGNVKTGFMNIENVKKFFT